jgi:hypothetical protein
MSSPREVLRPPILVSSVCGTLPYTPNLKFSSLLLFCCVFMNAVPPIYVLHSALQTLLAIQHIPAYISFLQVAKLICFIACIANLYFLLRRRKMFLLILCGFEDFQKSLNLSGAGMQITRHQVRLTIYTIFTIPWAINLLDIAIAPQKYTLSSLTSKLMHLIVGATLQSLGMQFLSCSILIFFYLKYINRRIVELQNVHLAGKSKENVSKQIENLRAAHNKLCENAFLINKVYGIYLLLPLSFSSIQLQTNSFKIIKYIIDYVTESHYESLGSAQWLISIMWICNDAIKLVTYFRIANLVRIEVQLY